MEQITLGKTGIKTLNVGFGGIPLQRASQPEAETVIRYCLEKGVNFFDSARAYSVSERLIGSAVRHCRKDVFLASKAPAVTAEEMFNQVSVSLNEFGTDYIDLYQPHNVKSKEDIDAIFSPGGAYEAFERLRERGAVLHFGLTSHKREVLGHAVNNYGGKIETIMFPYNIVENQGEELFKKAKKMDIATIAMKPFAGGNITDISLALGYVLNADFIDIALAGIGSLAEAEENLNISLAPLSAAETEKCETIRNELGKDFCRRCGYCAPCPAGIDIPGVFSMHNYAKKYGLKAWAVSRYGLMPKGAGDCVGCGYAKHAVRTG